MPKNAQSRDATYWQNLVQKMGGGESDFLFPQVGRTRVRLVWADADSDPIRAVNSSFQNRVKTKYVLWGYSPDDEESKLKIVVVPKTVGTGILALLAEGYDLFDPAEGHGISIIRSGSGLDTQYNVMPSPKPVPLPPEIVTQIEGRTLDQASQRYEEFNANRAARSGERTGVGGRRTSEQALGSAEDNGDDEDPGSRSDW
jgi:hypothetical protein